VKTLLTAAMIATMSVGVAAVPASSQVLLQFGQPDNGPTNKQLEHRADKVERQGDRRAAQAAANGNYQKAAQIDRRTENKADNIRDKKYDSNGNLIVIPIN
jgi:hypothetical protein